MTIPIHPGYQAVREGGAGLIDLSSRGRILVAGSEAVMFLNGLITNDMKTLAPHSWMPAVFPNVQGRMLAAVRILNRGDEFLLDTEAATREKVLQMLNRFTLAGDFRVTDISVHTAMLSLQGPKAGEALRVVFGDEAARVEKQKVIETRRDDTEITIIRATHTAEDGFDLFINAADDARLREAFMSTGAEPVSDAAAEALRIEAGLPRYGLDMDESTIVTETNLDDAVSFTKGCYLGQEIIVRIKHRGHVAKKLTGITFSEYVEVESGAKILSADDKEIGRITSSAYSPKLARTIAFGYVKYDYLAAGTEVNVQSNATRFAGRVAELPFIRGSWQAE